ncbi:MAG: threonine dehydratase [Hyphomicrobiales bacterium]
MFSLAELEAAEALVRRFMPATPQYAWPLVAEAIGAEVFLKHENHTPTGAFKVRGGLVFMDGLKRQQPDVPGVVSATRGNHGQSLAYAGGKFGVPVTIVVPEGNSTEKNAAMQALGAELIVHGVDFDGAKAHAEVVARERGFYFAPSFAADLVRGVATYPLELFRAVADIDTVYVPIGLGSGISATILVRDLLQLSTRVVGVVSERAPGYADSFAAGRVVGSDRADTFADGVAVRVPDAAALAIIRKGADRIVTVSDDEIAEAMRVIYRATHSVAEGAGAAAFAALAKERAAMQGRRVAVMLTGQNIDAPLLATVLGGGTPKVG